MALKKKKKEKKLSFLLSVPLKLSITSCGLRSLTPTSQPFAEIHLSPNQRLFLSPTALKALTTNICWAHPMAQNCACRIQMGRNTLLWQSVLSREREPFGVRPGEQVLQSNDTHMGDKLKGKTNIKSVLVRPEQLQCALALIRQVPGALPEGWEHHFFFFFFFSKRVFPHVAFWCWRWWNVSSHNKGDYSEELVLICSDPLPQVDPNYTAQNPPRACFRKKNR